MVRCNCGTWILIFLVISPTIFHKSMSELDPRWVAKKRRMSHKVRKIMAVFLPFRFYHAYDNYMTYAFPHDELKPLAKTFTDSLVELGNLKLEHLPQEYHGSALTLVESLSSLVIMGNNTEFERAVLWLSENLTFDVDARINLFECNIRVLGGLVSAHILATDSTNRLVQRNYKNQLLILAEDLGRRFLPAFDTPTGLPYAWINLKYGVMENETTETSTSGCGSLILEMGALSRLAGDPSFESAALRALRKLWSMRSSLNLLGTTLDVETGEWIEYSSGIGAGVDSFYEYLMKAHILFGRDEFWRMFQPAYLAVQKYFRHGAWCKYLYLLFDDSFLVGRNYIFTTEGHPLPVVSAWHERLPETYIPSNWTSVKSKQKAKRASAMSLQVCPATTLKSGHGGQQVESACHILDVRNDHRCLSDEDCGVEASTCRQRSCSIAGYCGRWSFQ
ncbi:hypothetical protein HYC85_004656 [Camellia sinensis]|uniref:alpha-1,2-Mannosidase n=1 Tax=Camellia sinensis TaxID=4442 RepID=A0A7J7HYV1_CAMSI|nr:hypothetical protein HYC85_004656 [Camellia sinensis]